MNKKFLSIMRLGAVALIAGALTACGGDDDAAAPTPPPPATSGFDGLTTTVDPLDPATLGAITSVTIKSPPVITFKLRDSAGNPVLPAALVEVRAALAKFIPGAPDRWIPFGVKTATTPDPTKFMVSNELRSCGQTKGTADWVFNNVKYNATTAEYSYYFCTDVTTHPDWNAAAPYRVGLEIQYNQPATGGVVVKTTNPYVDFTLNQGIGQPIEDASGNDVLVRQMVVRESCNTCHNDLGQQGKFHGNRRIDPNYCALCHNDSGYDPVTAESLDIKVMVHKFHAGSRLTGSYAPSGLDATKMHFPQDQRNCTKCHTDAAIEGNLNVTPQGGNWKLYPSRNACGSCHDGIDFATGGGTTLDPSLPWATLGHVGGAQENDSGCADCHKPEQIAGINHIPVTKVTNSTGVTTYYASNDGRLPAGAKTVDYEIQSVSVNGTGNPVMVFRILQNGARLDLNAPTGISDQAIWPNFWGGPTAYFAYSVPQDGVATPADFNVYVNQSIVGVWNGSVTGGTATLTGPDANGFYTLTLVNRVIPANASMLTGALGYAAMYQTNVTGYLRTCPPIGASNCSNGLNVTAQDVSKTATGYTARRITAEADLCSNCHAKLGIFAETTFHSGQRNDPKMCAMCHNPNRTSSGWSADSTAFVHAIHGSDKRVVPYNWHATVYDANGVAQSSSTLLSAIPGYTVDTFAEIGFPGNLKNCLNCHAEGGYNFEGGLAQVPNRLHRTTASGTMAAANTVGSLSLSPYVAAGDVYGTTYNSSTNVASGTEGTSLVNSPIANACFGCHDGQTSADPSLSVKAHIESNGGGSIYRTRDFALLRQESCLLCHGPTQVVPIKGAHGL